MTNLRPPKQMRRLLERTAADPAPRIGRLPIGALTVLAVVMVACGSSPSSIPAPEAQPTGSLLVLETRPCNWLQPPDRCHTVGLARIGLDGERIEDLTPALPISMRSLALNQARDTIAWTWN